MLARSSRDTVITNIIQQTVGTLIFLTVPNFLTVSAFAEVTFVMVLLSFSIVADGGISLVYSRKMPSVYATGNKTEIERWNSSAFWTALAGSTLFAAAIAVIYVVKYGNTLMALLLIPLPPLTAVVTFSVGRLTAKADFSAYRAINSFQAITRLVTIPFTYWLGLFGWFLSQSLPAAATLLRLEKPRMQPRGGFDGDLVRRHLAEGLALVAVTFLWVQLLYSGRLFAAMYYPNETVALYGLLSAGYQVIASLVIATFLPVTVHILRLFGRDDRDAVNFIFKAINLSILPISVLAISAAELGPPLLAALFPQYRIDTSVLNSLLYGLFAFPILVTLGNLFIGKTKASLYIVILLVSLGLDWTLVLVLEPLLGYRSAAVAQLASISACALLMLLVSFHAFSGLIERKVHKLAMIFGQLTLWVTIYFLIRVLLGGK